MKKYFFTYTLSVIFLLLLCTSCMMKMSFLTNETYLIDLGIKNQSANQVILHIFILANNAIENEKIKTNEELTSFIQYNSSMISDSNKKILNSILSGKTFEENYNIIKNYIKTFGK